LGDAEFAVLFFGRNLAKESSNLGDAEFTILFFWERWNFVWQEKSSNLGDVEFVIPLFWEGWNFTEFAVLPDPLLIPAITLIEQSR